MLHTDVCFPGSTHVTAQARQKDPRQGSAQHRAWAHAAQASHGFPASGEVGAGGVAAEGVWMLQPGWVSRVPASGQHICGAQAESDGEPW